MTDRRWRPDMTDRRWRPDMTESPSTGSGQSSVLCPDGLPVYREILRPYNAAIQSVHNLTFYRSIYSNTIQRECDQVSIIRMAL